MKQEINISFDHIKENCKSIKDIQELEIGVTDDRNIK